MFFVVTVGFLAGVAIVAAGEESRHLGDNVIMIVVHVEVNSLVFLRTTVSDIIVVLFRHDIDLIIGQVRLEQFGLGQSRTDQEAPQRFGEVPVPSAFASAFGDPIRTCSVDRYRAWLWRLRELAPSIIHPRSVFL